MRIGLVSVLFGTLLLLAGLLTRNRAQSIYSIYRGILGSRSFPETGPKRDRILRFFRDAGAVFSAVGLVLIGLAFYHLLVAL